VVAIAARRSHASEREKMEAGEALSGAVEPQMVGHVVLSNVAVAHRPITSWSMLSVSNHHLSAPTLRTKPAEASQPAQFITASLFRAMIRTENVQNTFDKPCSSQKSFNGT